MYSYVNSLESMQMGQFELNITDLFTSCGRKYFFIAASMFPSDVVSSCSVGAFGRLYIT